MSHWAWLITLVIALTILGLAALGLVTKYYYWGARGTPPPSQEQRRLMREEEERRARENK